MFISNILEKKIIHKNNTKYYKNTKCVRCITARTL